MKRLLFILSVFVALVALSVLPAFAADRVFSASSPTNISYINVTETSPSGSRNYPVMYAENDYDDLSGVYVKRPYMTRARFVYSVPVSLIKGNYYNLYVNGNGFTSYSIERISIDLFNSANERIDIEYSGISHTGFVSDLSFGNQPSASSVGNFNFSLDCDFTAITDDSLIYVRFIIIFSSDNVTTSSNYQGLIGISNSTDFIKLTAYDMSNPQNPSYNELDDSGINDLDNLEGNITGGVSGDLDEASSMFKGFGSTILDFSGGLLFVSAVFRSLLNYCPSWYGIIQFSLAIGICIFLVGAVSMVVGRSSRSAVKSDKTYGRKK